MEITGKIKKIMDLQNVSEKFRKREFVLTVDEHTPYPQYIIFQTTQDKCAILDNLRVNDEVKVFFNIRGREWTSPQDNQIKYFVSLEAWRIDKFTPVSASGSDTTTSQIASNHQSSSSVGQSSVSPTNTMGASDINLNSDDDLPF